MIFNNDINAIPHLEKISLNTKNSIAQIHAMHTLNGMDKLSIDVLEKILASDSKNNTYSHAILLSEQFATLDRLPYMLEITKNLISKNNPETNLYISTSLGAWVQLSTEQLFPLVLNLSNKYSNSLLYQEGLINSLRGNEEAFVLFLKNSEIDISKTKLSKILETTISNKSKRIKNSIYTQTTVGTDGRTAGYKIFRNLCATCHGADGDGIEGLAPPLKNSEYVTESSKKLALVILHGLSGPIHVNNKLYNLPLTMPGLVNNHEYTDQDIQDLITYMHNAFPGKNEGISAEDIKLLRDQKPVNGVFTEEELLQLK